MPWPDPFCDERRCLSLEGLHGSLKIAAEMALSYEKSQDDDPRAVACRLQAAWLHEELRKELKDVQKKKEYELKQPEWVAIAEDLERYDKKKARFPAFNLEGPEAMREAIRKQGWRLNRDHNIPPQYDLQKLNWHEGIIDQMAAAFQEKTDLTNILYTRPGKGMLPLFVSWLPDALLPEAHPRKKNVRRFLEVSRQDQEVWSQLLRSALEEICTHPQEYAKKIPKVVDEGVIKELLEGVAKPASLKRAKQIGEGSSIEIQPVARRGVKKRARETVPLVKTRVPLALTGSPSSSPEYIPVQDFNPDPFLETKEKKQDEELFQLCKQRLEKLFQKSGQSKGLERSEWRRLRQDIYHFSMNRTQKNGLKVKEESIPELSHQLQLQIDQLQRQQDELRDEIVEMVNEALFESPESSMRKIAARLSRQQDTLSIHDILILYARNELTKELGGVLLSIKIGNYLDVALLKQKYQRSLRHLAELRTNGLDEAAKERLMEAAAEALTFQTAYEPILHPEMLVMEHLLDIALRQDQVEFLLQLCMIEKKPGMVLQAPPGFGKTTKIIPLYMLLKADREHLSLCLLPDQILEWIFLELKESLSAFDLWLRPLQIHAAEELTLEKWQEIYGILDETRKNGQLLIMGAKTAHALNTQLDKAFVECCRGDPHLREQTRKKFECIQEIVFLLQEKCLPVGDEAHLWLNTRREVNTPSGEEVSLRPEEQQGLLFLYELILTDPVCKQLYKYEFSQGGNACGNACGNAAAPFTEEAYHAEGKSIFAQRLLEKLRNEPISEDQNAASICRWFSACSDQEKKWLYAFLIRKEPDSEEYREASRWVARIQNHSVANLLHLFEQELQVLLPTTFKKKYGESYTLQDKVAFFAHNGVPSVGSEFGNPHETLNYTIQAFAKQGISSKIVQERVSQLQEEAFAELKPAVDLSETEAYRKFLALSPKNAKRHLFRMSQKEIEELSQEINHSGKPLRELLLHFITPAVRFFRKKFNSNCYRLARLLPNMRAMTGSLTENYAYPTLYQSIPWRGTDSKTLFALYKALFPFSIESYLVTAKQETPEELLVLLKASLQEGNPIRLIVDAGGYLNGVDIDLLVEEWGKVIVKNRSEIKEICYRKRGELMVYVLETGKRMALSASSARPEERLTILEQPDATGADTKQAARSVSFVTLGRNTPFFLLAQAVWRARELDKEQRPLFVVSDDLKKIIRSVLSLSNQDPIGLDELILYTLKVQIGVQEQDNEAGIKLQMREHLQHLIYAVVKKCRAEGKEYSDLLIPEVAALFERQMPVEARLMYAELLVKGKAAAVLGEDSTALFKQFEAAWNLSPTLRAHLELRRVQKELEELIIPGIVAEELETRRGAHSSGMLQEVEMAQEVKMELTRDLISEKSAEKQIFWRRLPWSLQAIEGSQPSLLSGLYKQVGEATRSLSQQYGLPDMEEAKKWAAWPLAVIEKGSNMAQQAYSSLVGGKEESYKEAFFLSLSDFCSLSKVQQAVDSASLWDPELKASFNVATHKALSVSDHVAQPFDASQKHVSYALIKRNPANGEWEVGLLDLEDTEYFLKTLPPLRGKKPEGNQWECALYDLKQGVIEKGPGSLSDKEIQKSSKAARLLAQAKFFYGMVQFTSAEEAELRKWSGEKGRELLLKLFKDQVTQHRSDRTLLIEKMEKLLGSKNQSTVEASRPQRSA